jgi:branched-subunit amino acid ABC-type transport system permease component
LDYSLYIVALCFSALLSLLGVALTMRHRASGIPDFSIVLYVGLGVVVTGSTVALLGLNLYLSPVFSFVVGCVVGGAEYLGVMRVMERRGDGAVPRVLCTIGIQVLASALLFIWGDRIDASTGLDYSIFHSVRLYDFVLFDLPGYSYMIPLICIVVYLALLYLWRRTTLGLRLIASEENPELAMVQGVDPWRLKLLFWALSGGITCAAGSLYPPFWHTFPGNGAAWLAPVMAVGVLGGFDSLALAVVAAFAIGLSEILGTLWLMITFGGWAGEYGAMIPIAILYLSMLFIPRGLVGLKGQLIDVKSGLSRLGTRRLFRLLTLGLLLAGLFVMADASRRSALENETTGWINVSNRVGKAGALIYPDTATPNLLENQQFSRVYPPANVEQVPNLGSFTTIIKNRGATVVYRHDGALYLIVDPSLGYVYDPQRDNFGR